MSILNYSEISPTDFNQNAIKLIGDDWMLITAGNESGFNTMTASWGFMGEIWNKDSIICFIRPQRYTYEFIEKTNIFSLSFLSPGNKDALTLCGTESGRDGDKVARAGLSPLFADDTVFFDQANLVLICEKMYTFNIEPENFIDSSFSEKFYPDKDYHKAYVSKILKVYKKI